MAQDEIVQFGIEVNEVIHIMPVQKRFAESLDEALGKVDELFHAAALLREHGEGENHV